MTIIWCMAPQIWSMTDKIFCYFRPFLPFYPTKNQKNNKNACIILHKCTKNYDHMLYCSWDMVLNGYDCYYPYWAIFCPFTPLTDQKIKIKKMQKKKHLEISLFYTYVPNIMIRWCTVPDIWCITDGQTDGGKK